MNIPIFKAFRVIAIFLIAVTLIGFTLLDDIEEIWSEELLFSDKIPIKYEQLYLDETIHQEKSHVKLLAYGDAGKGNSAQYLVSEGMWSVCKKEPCDLVIGLGDNIYPSGVSSTEDKLWLTAFEKPYKKFVDGGGTDFWMAVGNHDRRGSIDAQIQYSLKSPIWKMPAPDYAIPSLPEWLNIYVLDTSFIAPGSDIPFFQSKISSNFEQQLTRARKSICGKPGWKVIVAHHPLYSNGRRNNRFREKNLREALLPFIESCGVHLVISGHEHMQEHLTSSKFDMIIQGAASSIRNDYRKVDDDIVLKYMGDDLGFSMLDFSIDRLLIRFYDEKGESIYKDTIKYSSSKSGSGNYPKSNGLL